jgi:hypothetical protein
MLKVKTKLNSGAQSSSPLPWREAKGEVLIFSIWLLLTILVAYYHEIWRDEMRALTIAVNSANWSQLPADLKNEGHPILWYVLLKFTYSLWQNPVVLKVISYLIGAASSGLFLFYFRLPILWKALFLFSNILFYENTVMCRNYGITSLLIILFSVAEQRSKLHWPLVCIMLLMQTNVIGLIVGIVLFGYLVFYHFWPHFWLKLYFWVGLAIIVSGIMLFYQITSPDATSDLARVRNISDFLNTGLWSALTLQHVFVPKVPYLSIAICGIFLAFFASNWRLLLLMYGCLFAMSMIGKEVNLLSMRHLGVFFTFFLFVVQQYVAQNASDSLKPWSQKMYKFVLPTFLVGLCCVNMVLCYQDLTSPWSQSKNLSEYLKTQPKYQNAILVAEPDYLIEPIPYYSNHATYVPREQKMSRYTHFTSLNQYKLSLKALANWSDSVQHTSGAATLLMTSFAIIPGKDSVYSYRVFGAKNFVVDSLTSLRLVHLREFRGAFGDENFSLYEIRR